MKKIVFSAFIFLFLFSGASSLISQDKTPLGVGPAFAEEPTTIYFFWGDGCPHCAEEKIFLEQMKEKYPELEVEMFETWNNRENAQLFREAADAYNIRSRLVPTTFIGDFDPIVGYSERINSEIERKIADCIENGCPDPGIKAGIKEEEENRENQHETCIHFFYKDDCSQCQRLLEKDLLEELEEKYSIDIKRHNINLEEEDQLYQVFKSNYGLSSGAYPIVFLENNYYLGESSIRKNLEDHIIKCQEEGCACAMEEIEGITPSLPGRSDFTPEGEQTVDLPLAGTVDLSNTPLFLSTGLIAFVDGFNPCSLWLISFLLGIVIYTRSRKKTLLVGLTFLVVTTAAYGLFMAGLLNVFSYIAYLNWIQIGVALIALIFALVNIKDYFWYKKGVSFTISDKYKPKIFKNVRNIMKGERSTWGMVVGTAGLALGVVLVELPCTAGFPVVWTNLLAQYQVTTPTFLLLLLLYLGIYMLDEMIVVGGAALTLKAGNFEEKHGRMLKLVGGVIMLSLAIVMLVDPEIMNRIETSLLIFGGSIAASFLIMLVHRRVLPRFGIKIGTEKDLAPEEEQTETDENKQENPK
jgi:thiol-disulfide isomerase/thioredoxin/cytochrome c biogenesis protein CcdA